MFDALILPAMKAFSAFSLPITMSMKVSPDAKLITQVGSPTLPFAVVTEPPEIATEYSPIPLMSKSRLAVQPAPFSGRKASAMREKTSSVTCCGVTGAAAAGAAAGAGAAPTESASISGRRREISCAVQWPSSRCAPGVSSILYSMISAPWQPKVRPVTSAARSLARKTTIGETYSGFWSSATMSMSSVIRVLAMGAMQFARTPDRPSSIAITLVNDQMPAFAAA